MFYSIVILANLYLIPLLCGFISLEIKGESFNKKNFKRFEGKVKEDLKFCEVVSWRHTKFNYCLAETTKVSQTMNSYAKSETS